MRTNRIYNLNIPFFQIETKKTSLREYYWIRTLLMASILFLSMPASAWWDTQVAAQKSEPTVKEFPAAQCSGAAKVIDDRQADGGKGGKAGLPHENTPINQVLS